MPPSIVLEVLRILKAEVNLRDETRVVEQTKPAVAPQQHELASTSLKETQDNLRIRTETVIDQLEQLQQDEGKNYGKELKKLETALGAMQDAVDLLAVSETGSGTIAAETEAIEALLITKRSGSGGGGGGGSTPGGGGGEGEASMPSALAGIGDDTLTEERIVDQSTGSSKSGIPEEFRSELDAYFSALEGQTGG
ncbi:MAG: hypothetical protein R3C28_01650 [Pirellulaceae bacterium]